MTKKTRRAIEAAMLPPIPPAKTYVPPPPQLQAANPRGGRGMLAAPEVAAAKQIVEYWIGHVATGDPVSGLTREASDQVAALLAETLSDRQREILDLLNDGSSERQTADALSISRGSVRTQRDRAIAKLQEAFSGPR